MDAAHAQLRPFMVPLRPQGSDEPRLLEGRVTPEGYRLSGFGGEALLDSECLAADAEGARCSVRPGRHGLGAGHQVLVCIGPDGTDLPVLQLELSPVTSAMRRARPLFGRLGGDADLIALLSPPAWVVRLRFGASGHLVPAQNRPEPSALH